MPEPLRLGYACEWDGDARRTWSGSAWGLRQALDPLASVVDVPTQPQGLTTRAARRVIREAHERWGRTPYPYSRMQSLVAGRKVRAADGVVDAVLQINDLGVSGRPYWVYQDLSYSAVKELRGRLDPHLTNQGGLGQAALERRLEREAEVYASAAGVFTMSAWLKRRLVRDGIPPERVVVVGSGRNSELVEVRHRPAGTRALFVGREWTRKGGDVALAGLALLRRRRPEVTLTVVGPESVPAPLPEWVTFLGPRSSAEVAGLMATHDVFVMPSRFEPYGIVFLEALAHGMPCLARNDFAMPEIITHAKDGMLIDDDDPAACSEAIERCLDDPVLRDHVWRTRQERAATSSWTTVATAVVTHVQQRLVA